MYDITKMSPHSGRMLNENSEAVNVADVISDIFDPESKTLSTESIINDGGNTAQGSTTDLPAVGGDEISATVVSLLKGILNRVDVLVHTSIEGTLESDGWVANTQTINMVGVTETNTIIVSPHQDSYNEYVAHTVIATAQGINTITFTCTTQPEADLHVNVVIL